MGVRSVYRAIKIIELIGEKRSIALPEIAQQLSLPKSSAYEILTTLCKADFICRDKNNNYSLGIRLIELGNKAQLNLEIRRIATPILKELNEELDETVHLTVLDNDEILYVECFESTKRLRTYSVIGVRAPLHCTAVGKAILSMQDEKEIKRIISTKGLTQFTHNTITDPQKLLKELQETRKRGYAIDDIEHEEGVRCVGAPIFDISGRVYASISISGPSQRITLDRIPEIGELVKEKANKISALLGYKKGC